MADPKPQQKSIAAAKTMKKIMADHFLSIDAAVQDPKRKVAWCTSVGPAELLHGFGFEVYFPENHSAILGATRKASEYIPFANAAGYSPEICSYLTADVGAFLQGYTPLTEAYGIKSVPSPTCWSTTPTSAGTSRTGSCGTPASGTYRAWASTPTATSAP